MERVGFVAVNLFGNLDREEYGPNAERLIAIGRKPMSRQLENVQSPTLAMFDKDPLRAALSRFL